MANTEMIIKFFKTLETVDFVQYPAIFSLSIDEIDFNLTITYQCKFVKDELMMCYIENNQPKIDFVKKELKRIKKYLLGIDTYKLLLGENMNIDVLPETKTKIEKIKLSCIDELLNFINDYEQPQQIEIINGNEKATFVNNFDNIPEIEIFNHFKAELVDKRYLTEQELNDYLKAAFELKKIPETLFKLIHKPADKKIYTVFYTYYKEISGKPHNQQTKYAELLGNYFQGFKTETIKSNWTRGYVKKK